MNTDVNATLKRDGGKGETGNSSQEMILTAAKELIMRSGFDGFSMRQLAEQSGFAKATIYHHFRDKQALYLKVLESEMQESRRQMAAVIDPGASVVEQLRSAVRAYLQMLEAKHYSMFLMLREIGHLEEELRTLILRERQSIVEPFQSILAAGVDAGTFRRLDPATAAIALLGMMNSVGTSRFFIGEEKISERDVALVVDLFLHGVEV